MAEEVQHDIDYPTVEDDDETLRLSKESEILVHDEQGSEATADETVKEPYPRRKTRSQGKKAFNIPAAASPSDLEDEATPPKCRIVRIKARPKNYRSLPELFPPSPIPRKAKKPAARKGRSLA
jgi:hypothetical protein